MGWDGPDQHKFYSCVLPLFAVLKSVDFPLSFSSSIRQYVRANCVQREGSSGLHHFISVIVARGSVLEFLDC